MEGLPEGWEVKELGQIAILVNGKAFSQDELLSEGKYKVLRVGNFFTNENWYYSNLELDAHKYVAEGDLMYAWSASFGPRYWNGVKTIYHYHIWKVLPLEKIEKSFLFYLLDFDTEKLLSTKQGGTMFHITKGDMEKRKSIIPPLPEQRAIAQILSTQDRLIQALIALIAQKERRKKWLMQRLLTGKMRLAGFEGEWKKVGAGDVFQSISRKGFDNEDLLSSTQENGIIPRRMLETRVVMPEGSTAGYKLVESGNFVISLRSFQGGIEYSNFRGIVSPAYTVLASRKPISTDFYKQYFKSREFISRLSIAVIGIRDGKQISYEDFCNVKIPHPPLPEQTAIAQLLTLADREIDLLKQQVEAHRNQKKWLMQVLLTGKKRVPGISG